MQEGKVIEKDILKRQCQKWENTFSKQADMFGKEPSFPAKKAAAKFKKEGKKTVLELGGGQGRDTIFFAKQGFEVYVLDYCENGVKTINKKAEELNLSNLINVKRHDVREPFPFSDEQFGACYSHMLYCMAFTTEELEFISEEINRVLKPNGLNIYTARNTNDAHYKRGIHRGEDMYENNGFIVHFFSKEKVEYLTKGFKLINITEFEEGRLPRKLYQVTLQKVNST